MEQWSLTMLNKGYFEQVFTYRWFSQLLTVYFLLGTANRAWHSAGWRVYPFGNVLLIKLFKPAMVPIVAIVTIFAPLLHKSLYVNEACIILVSIHLLTTYFPISGRNRLVISQIYNYLHEVAHNPTLTQKCQGSKNYMSGSTCLAFYNKI